MTFPVFASGDVLNASDMNAVGLWLVKTQTIGTTVSSVAVTGAFSSDYDNYIITVTGGAASGTQNYLLMQLGATTTGYYFGGYYSDYGTANVVSVRGSNVASWRVGAYNSTTPMTAIVEVFQPNAAVETRYNARFMEVAAAGTGQSNGGYVSGTTQYTAFTLLPTSGTLTGGTIRVYGYRN